jgi:hypothetical protein
LRTAAFIGALAVLHLFFHTLNVSRALLGAIAPLIFFAYSGLYWGSRRAAFVK